MDGQIGFAVVIGGRRKSGNEFDRQSYYVQRVGFMARAEPCPELALLAVPALKCPQKERFEPIKTPYGNRRIREVNKRKSGVEKH